MVLCAHNEKLPIKTKTIFWLDIIKIIDIKMWKILLFVFCDGRDDNGIKPFKGWME